MKRYFLLMLLFHFFVVLALHSQIKDLRIAFYNVENLFDYFDDSTKNDDAFTPLGTNHWKKERYETKLNHLYKTIMAMDCPAILGMCEVENDKVLLDLTKGTLLRQFNYDFVHFESADSRGIDVALIYRNDIVQLDTAFPVPFIVPPDTISKTRDFLYANFQPINVKNNFLYVIVCHFPSKYGGLMATKQRRFMAGQLLRKTVDAIFDKDSNANIITMGDFNDEATDESIISGFGALCVPKIQGSLSRQEALNKNDMINLMCGMKTDLGTHKYQDTWSIIDQIMVSKSLYTVGNQFVATKANIFAADFLLVDDVKYLGKKTNRTYIGFKYNGGYSDHLPVYVDIYFNNAATPGSVLPSRYSSIAPPPVEM
jgi:predicted extracellular nuclease